MSYGDSEYTLYGGCGVAGCLDCLPLYIVQYDPMEGTFIQKEIADFSYTLVED